MAELGPDLANSEKDGKEQGTTSEDLEQEFSPWLLHG
jgi:hypothetical protein